MKTQNLINFLTDIHSLCTKKHGVDYYGRNRLFKIKEHTIPYLINHPKDKPELWMYMQDIHNWVKYYEFTWDEIKELIEKHSLVD